MTADRRVCSYTYVQDSCGRGRDAGPAYLVGTTCTALLG